MNENPLPKRDWVLLPALSLLTIVLIIAAVEYASRVLLAPSASTTLKCMVIDDPSTGVRAIPNSACSQKIAESELITYHINSCGHRAGIECQPKAAGTYRIVMVGSSYNYGMWVAREQSFAALLPQQLSMLTGRRIELYNEAMQWGFPKSVGLRVKAILDAQPDLILWPLTPADINSVNEVLPWTGPPPEAAKDPHSGWRYRLQTAFSSKSPSEFVADAWKRLTAPLNEDPAVLLLQHEIFQSQSQFVKQYLMQADHADYLRVSPSPAFDEHLASFTQAFADVQAQAASAGVPVMVALLPERAQAAMISMKQWPKGFDPYKLGNDLRAIVTSHGGTYVDVLSKYREIPNPEQGFLPVDGHPTAAGHATIADLLSQAISADGIPAFKASN